MVTAGNLHFLSVYLQNVIPGINKLLQIIIACVKTLRLFYKTQKNDIFLLDLELQNSAPLNK